MKPSWASTLPQPAIVLRFRENPCATITTGAASVVCGRKQSTFTDLPVSRTVYVPLLMPAGTFTAGMRRKLHDAQVTAVTASVSSPASEISHRFLLDQLCHIADELQTRESHPPANTGREFASVRMRATAARLSL